MTITRDHIGIVIMDIVNNQLITRRYCNYTQAEAKADFKQYIKDITK